MSINPYESPKILLADKRHALKNCREIAVRDVRIALVIMLVPAVYNFAFFNFSAGVNTPIQNVFRTINLISMVSIVSAIWFFGLTAVEILTGVIYSMTARRSVLNDWKETLYTILRRMPLFAVPGALLWTIWVLSFYQFRLGFYIVSIPIGIAAHFLAAGLYVPLSYRWYRLEHFSHEQFHSEPMR